MVEAQEQAKQLDSVTDRVQEKEVDATKAQEAMTALSTPPGGTSGGGTAPGGGVGAGSPGVAVALSRDDVDLIVSELEITEEAAETALREVAPTVKEGESLVVAALRKLVTS